MSASNRQIRASGGSPGPAGRQTADGKRVYRLTPPLIIWWCWVALIVLSMADLLIQGHEFVSLQFAMALLTATGLVFACTVWPKVIADDDGITVRNPFRTFRAPWGAVKGIFLADSVEVQCVRGGQRKDKTVFSWALSAPRRARAKAQLRGRQWDRGRRSPPTGYNRLSGQAKEVVQMTPAEVIARELAALSDQAKTKLPQEIVIEPTAVLAASWAWIPLAAVLLPAIAFVLSEVLK